MTKSTAGADIRLVGVTKRYGAVTSVDAIDLDVAPGEFLTLLGPSGSGKTSVLNIVAGFIAPDSGDILVGGRSVRSEAPQHRGFGVVFQSYAIFPHMTVFENVAFPLRMRRQSDATIKKAVSDVLELVGLGGLGPRFGHELSGGQQQRVAFARAVVFNPPVLLMDESLSALDRNLRQQLQHELRDLQKRLGITVLFVTHDQEEALAMSDRIAVMNHGKIEQIGTGRDLYERPDSEFVAKFFGESNVFAGEVTAADAGGVRVASGPLAFSAAARPGFENGRPVRVYLRPESVRLGALGEAGHRATVEAPTYLGGSVRATLRLADGPQLIARLPGSTALTPGQEVSVSWDDRELRVFPVPHHAS